MLINGLLQFQNDVSAMLGFLVLGYVRPMGFTLTFVVFSWAAINTTLLRSAFALAVAIPMVVPVLPDLAARGLPTNLDLIAAGGRELLIGIGLGFACGAPFAVATAAGGIIDIYRGSTDPTPDPSGGVASPFGLVFQIINLYIFAVMGGFSLVIGLIYQSYASWPFLEPVGLLDSRMVEAAIMMVRAIAISALAIAAPLLLAMFLVDAFVGLGGKVAPRLQFNGLDLLVKNIVLISLMPFYLSILTEVLRKHMMELSAIGKLLEKLAP